jgi:hypothetical protein
MQILGTSILIKNLEQHIVYANINTQTKESKDAKR